MKLFTVLLSLLTVTLIPISAQGSNQTEIVHIAVMTLLQVESPIPENELRVIDNAMNALHTELDEIVAEVNAAIPEPPARKLRGSARILPCNACAHVAASYPGCWVNGVFRERCDRELSFHEDLSEEEIAKLSEEDRRRHLEVAVLCDEAKVGIASAVLENEIKGVIPVPTGGEFIERCLFSYA